MAKNAFKDVYNYQKNKKIKGLKSTRSSVFYTEKELQSIELNAADDKDDLNLN